MKFLDKKEEVIDFRLTKEGIDKLSSGTLDFDSFSLEDAEVIYDSEEYAGIISISDHDRIKEVPVMMVYNQPKGEPSIGSADLGSQENPAWNVGFWQEGVASFGGQTYDTDFGTEDIPQINFEIEYRISEGNGTPIRTTPKEFIGDPQPVIADKFRTSTFSDGSFVQVDGSSILLSVREENSPTNSFDYDVEVFLVDDQEGEEILTRLRFGSDALELNKEDQEYFLEILKDEEIDDNLLCQVLGIADSDNVFNPPIECGEIVLGEITEESYRDRYEEGSGRDKEC